MFKKNEITKPRWNPFQELEDIQDQMNSLFLRSGFENGNGSPLALAAELGDWSPAVDIAEDDDEFTITADLPEVKKDQVQVTLDDGLLTIRGEREHHEEKKKKRFHRVERSYGKYVRSFRIPSEVESEKIDAAFHDGVLTIHLPKGEEAKTHQKKIAIH